MNLPKITLITPSLNQAEFLEETIQSILSQNYPNLEYFIVDGGSTDGSVEIIKKYEKQITWWVSEPDRGQSHALNKGLEKATGDIFNWVNSDDLLAPGALWEVANAFSANPEANIICGHYTAFSQENIYPKMRMKLFPDLERTIVFGHVSPCCMYYRVKVLRPLGNLDQRLEYCMDLELWHRYLEKYGQNWFQFLDSNLAFFRLHPASKTLTQRKNFYREIFNVSFSILTSSSEKTWGTSLLSSLSIPLFYERRWSFRKFRKKDFTAYFIQNMLENLHEKFTLLKFISGYFTSLILKPYGRDWRFYILPFRRIKWSLQSKQKASKRIDNLPMPSDVIIAHYLLEKSLALQLRQASKEKRQQLYRTLYDELFQKVPYLNAAVSDPVKRYRKIKGEMNFLKRYLNPNTTFMEIGPGDCALSINVATHVKKVFAVDVSSEITSGIQRPANFQLLISDGVSIPVSPNSVDVVFSNQLMEHLHPEDALEQLCNVHKSLITGGIYLCITPNRLGGPYDVSKYFDETATGFHLKEYTHSELSNILKKAGFSKIQARIGGKGFYINIPLLPIVILEKSIEKLPCRIRRKLANAIPIVWLLGIKIIAYKQP